MNLRSALAGLGVAQRGEPAVVRAALHLQPPRLSRLRETLRIADRALGHARDMNVCAALDHETIHVK